jgi:NitT/TauT family transport system substrate-binding protein
MAASARPGASTPTKKITIGYPAATAAFTAVWIAAEENMFANYGIQADMKGLDASVMAAAMMSGELQYSTSGTLINAVLANSDLIIFGRITRTPVVYLYATKDNSRVEDLRGKTIADTTVGSPPDSYLHDILDKHGLKDSDVKIVHAPNPTAMYGVMASGQAVACICPIPINMQARNAGFVELTNTVKEGTLALGPALGAKKSRLKEDPATARGIILALRDAVSFMFANPARTKEVMGKYTRTDPGPDLDETYDSYKSNLNWEIGPVRAEDVASTLRWLPDTKASTINPNNLFDNSLVEAALR